MLTLIDVSSRSTVSPFMFVSVGGHTLGQIGRSHS
jgi:hypothetical protein